MYVCIYFIHFTKERIHNIKKIKIYFHFQFLFILNIQLMKKLIIAVVCFIHVLLFGISFGAISEQFKCFRAIVEGSIQGIEDRIEKRTTQMKKSEKFQILPLNLRTDIQNKLKTFLDGEKIPKAFVSLEKAMEKAKNALLANEEYAKAAIDKIAEMIDDIEALDERIDGLEKLIQEHKNSPIRLSDLKGKKMLGDIPEISNEVNEIFKFDILMQWPDCASKEIILGLRSDINDFPKEIATEMAGRFWMKSAEFVLTKFLGISDLYFMSKSLVFNCALLDLATQLVQRVEDDENDANEALRLKFEKRIKLSAFVAHLGTMDNEGHKQKKGL